MSRTRLECFGTRGRKSTFSKLPCPPRMPRVYASGASATPPETGGSNMGKNEYTAATHPFS